MSSWRALAGLAVVAACGRVGFDPIAGVDAPVCAADVDTTSDAANCGACGHSCLGGVCVDSGCQPIQLASGQGSLRGIVVDATHVYWTGPGAVTRTIKTGGVLETVATFAGTGFRMIEHAGYLYWVTRDTGLVARALMMAGATTETLATNQGDAGGVATDGTTVWWDNYPTGNLYADVIGANQPIALLPAPDTDLAAIRLIGATLYYLKAEHELDRIDVAGGQAATVVANASTWELAIDGDDVFMADMTGARIVRASLATGEVTVLADAGEPWGIAIDATDVYVANESGGSIERVARTGGTPEYLAMTNLPVGIALDATAVYWTTLDGLVMKIAK